MGDAEQDMVALRKVVPMAMVGAEVKSVADPDGSIAGHYAQVETEYDPFGYNR
jgi:hypothetical protein